MRLPTFAVTSRLRMAFASETAMPQPSLKSLQLMGLARRRRVTSSSFAALIGLAIGCSALCGCVHRRMTILTDPPGAHVLMDGQEVGFTPVSVDYLYDGTREFMFEKDGFETLTVLQRVEAPWYLRPPFDFISDNFLPFQVTNRHEFMYKLRPKVVVPTKELLDRANALRSESQLSPWGHSHR